MPRNHAPQDTVCGQKWGMYTLVIPTGCAVAASIVQGIMVGIMQVTKAAELDLRFDNGSSIALGVMFLLMSLLCRYGAEERRIES